MMERAVKSVVAAAVLAFAGCKSPKCACVGDEVTLVSPHGKAVVSLKGARVMSWTDADGREYFFMPEKIWSPAGDWSHGGMSICWPWFGRKGADQSLIHGFAKNAHFKLRGRQSIPGGESVTLGLRVDGAKSESFPHDVDLEITVAVTDVLSLKMKTVNLDDAPITITHGVQAYFPVEDYAQTVFFGVKRDDFAAVNGMDSAFAAGKSDFGVRNSKSGRGFRMKASGNSGVVVWSPGTVEPANRNLAADDCPKFIVIGPSARAKEGAITVPPKGFSTLEFEVRPM